MPDTRILVLGRTLILVLGRTLNLRLTSTLLITVIGPPFCYMCFVKHLIAELLLVDVAASRPFLLMFRLILIIVLSMSHI